MLIISEMNDSNDTRDGRKELGIFSYKVLDLATKQCNVT